jgi:fatty acid desaturase
MSLINWLLQVLIDWSAIVLCFIILTHYPTWWLFPICIFIIGTRQHAIAILGHEGAHRLICKNKIINDLLTNIFAFYPLGTSLEDYRDFHFKHHRTVGTDKDPELPLKKLGNQWEIPLSFKHLLYSVMDLIGFGIIHIFLIINTVRPTTIVRAVPIIIFDLITGLILYFSGLLWILTVWYTALITSFWFVFRLRTWTEHVGTNGTHILKRPSFLARLIFLPHNTWCHWLHHKNPNIPCWQLSSLMPRNGKTLKQLLKELM